jgi:hypothetical protein
MASHIRRGNTGTPHPSGAEAEAPVSRTRFAGGDIQSFTAALLRFGIETQPLQGTVMIKGTEPCGGSSILIVWQW